MKAADDGFAKSVVNVPSTDLNTTLTGVVGAAVVGAAVVGAAVIGAAVVGAAVVVVITGLAVKTNI